MRLLKYLLLFLIASCSDQDLSERYETVSPFSVLQFKSVFSVVLKQETEHSVTIIGDERFIHQIELQVINDTLVIADRSSGKWMHPNSNRIQLLISAPTIHTILADESYTLTNLGILAFDNLWIWNDDPVKVSDIDLEVDGGHIFYWNNWLSGGKLKLRGTVESAELWNYALHIIDAKDLHSNYTSIYNYGSQTCVVNAKIQLDYSLNGQGNIVVYGKPQQVNLKEKNSSGQLLFGD